MSRHPRIRAVGLPRHVMARGMTTHYHLCVCNTQPNLSEAFKYLNGNYALWWNARHRRVGHVFQGRFKDQIVQRDGYLSTAPVPAFLRADHLLGHFGDSAERQRENYVHHICGPSPQHDADAERFRSRERVIGDRAFKNAVAPSPGGSAVRDVAESPQPEEVALRL